MGSRVICIMVPTMWHPARRPPTGLPSTMCEVCPACVGVHTFAPRGWLGLRQWPSIVAMPGPLRDVRPDPPLPGPLETDTENRG